MQCFIVGVSSPSGGGKTTVIQQLTAVEPNTVALYFDEYDNRAVGANVHPQDLQQWLTDGADYNAWQTPGLLQDLKQLKQGQPIISPVDGTPIAPQPLVFLDAALGRANAALRPYLDFMVYIDTPLDIAMARRLQRDYFGNNQCSMQAALQEIHAMTTAYLAWARAAYLALDRQVKPQCDLVLDGCLPIDVLAGQILAAVQDRFPSQQ
jgi:uridine kinase